MMNSVVIGSGFGGMAASLRLKAKGHKVILIEKHPDLVVEQGTKKMVLLMVVRQ